jgi:hypothetical protein
MFVVDEIVTGDEAAVLCNHFDLHVLRERPLDELPGEIGTVRTSRNSDHVAP